LALGRDFPWINGEGGDEFAEIGLLHPGDRLGGGEPAALALLPLGPPVGDALDLEREDVDLAAPFEARG
jgi:hypothetical protein